MTQINVNEWTKYNDFFYGLFQVDFKLFTKYMSILIVTDENELSKGDGFFCTVSLLLREKQKTSTNKIPLRSPIRE